MHYSSLFYLVIFAGIFALIEIIHIYFNTNLMLLLIFLSAILKTNICKEKIKKLKITHAQA